LSGFWASADAAAVFAAALLFGLLNTLPAALAAFGDVSPPPFDFAIAHSFVL
jgi:hypothetical protein